MFLPIVKLLVGIGPVSKVALGALSAFFPVLLGELKLARAGLGFLAGDYYNQYDFPALYAVVAIVFVRAALANGAMSRLVRRSVAQRRLEN